MKFFVYIFTLLISTTLYSMEETYTNRASSTKLGSDFSLAIVDGRFPELLSGTFKDKSATLLLKLGIDERTSYGYMSAYTFNLDVVIKAYDNLGGLVDEEEVTLTVDYSPIGGLNTTDLNYYKREGFHRYVIEVEGVGGVIPSNLYLEAELTIDRYYDLDTEELPVLGCNSVKFNPDNNLETITHDLGLAAEIEENEQELEFWWDYIEGAEEYELEWTWVDNYRNTFTGFLGADKISFNERDFELNNTRVITKAQRYRIPLIYAKGYIIYRVRAVGVWTDAELADTDKRKYGKWSSGIGSKDKVLDWPHYVRVSVEHESLKNWQYQAVYAEEGKKKEIVSYFDGSLRNRQTVTRINSNKEAIVGENVYDNQGRSAIQILPTPVGNSALKYYSSLNVNRLSVPYSHYDFDWDTGVCEAAVKGMSTESGASRYYSSVPSAQGNWQDYVPDADTIPFVQVQYTPDNTGRIRSQSGVGRDFILDGEHAIKYYYLQPFQEELNRLFGYQVGYKSRYKKNMVVDANGQVSVSYLDPQGRVIATSLAGDNTTGGNGADPSLMSLAEEGGGQHVLQSVDLLNKEHVDSVDTDIDDNEKFVSPTFSPLVDALRFNTQLGCTDNGVDYEFDYRVRTGVFQDSCLSLLGIGYPYAYNLGLNVSDDCGYSVVKEGESATITGVITDIISGSTADPMYTSSTGLDKSYSFKSTLDKGSYTVSKLIRVNKDTLDKYTDHYMANNPCLLTFDDFFISTVDCGDTIPEEDLIFDEMGLNACFIAKRMMLSDLSPGGQYGGTEADDLTSVFNSPNVLGQGTLNIDKNWHYPSSDYTDEVTGLSYEVLTYFDGADYTPPITPLGVSEGLGGTPAESGTYSLNAKYLLHFSDVFPHWKSHWSEFLIEYHPEYCYLAYTEEICSETALVGSENISSETYNNYLQHVTSYSDAKSIGNVLGVDLIGNPFIDDFPLMDKDPYVIIDDYVLLDDATMILGEYVDGNGIKENLMEEIMTNYKGSGWNIWEYSMRVVLCGLDLDGDCTLPGDLDALETGSYTDDQLDHIWATYKQTYLGEKRKVDQLFRDMHAIRNGCYNDFIGSAVGPTPPAILGFIQYETFFGTIVSLYLDAIISAGSEDEPYPWMDGLYSRRFAEDIPRFTRIDNLYDASLPDDEAIEALSEEADAATYGSTGKCAFILDVEMFLNGMAHRGLFTPSVTDSDLIPEFTRDLYFEMGGGLRPDPDVVSPYPVNITTAAVGVDLKFTATNTVDGLELDNSIILEKPTVDWAWNWTNIVGMEMMYYIPNSLIADDYLFKVLAKVVVGLDTVEVVLSGRTEVAIGECDYPIPCGRPESFGDALGALYNKLFVSEKLDLIPSVESLSSHIAWYAGTEIETQLSDYGLTAQITSKTFGLDHVITLTSDVRKITITFASALAATDIYVGASFDPITSELTINYLDPTGLEPESHSITGTVEFVDAATDYVLDLDLGCDDCGPGDKSDLENRIKELMNYVLITSPVAPINYDPSDPIVELKNILPFTDFTADFIDVEFGIYDYDLTSTAFKFYLSKDPSCHDFQFSISSAGSLLNLESIIDVVITPNEPGYDITVTGLLTDESTVVLELQGSPEQRTNCFNYAPCNDCTPLAIAPNSCDEQWKAYNDKVTDLNDDIIALDADAFLFKTYTKEEFCETNFAYSTAAYIYYLTTFGITSPEDDHYLTIAEFSLTELTLSFSYYDDVSLETTDMEDVIDGYDDYLDNVDSEEQWTTYVNDIYMLDNQFCPNPMSIEIDTIIELPCEDYTANVDTVNATTDYETYLENTRASFRQRYLEGAISSLIENYEMDYPDKEYHYTLYYYDQAGNLVQTVPPKGVDRIETTIDMESVNIARKNNNSPANLDDEEPDVIPKHTYQTQYHYNSLNQLVWQETPDGGESYFAYDYLGRLVVSQNAKQLAYDDEVLSGNEEQFSYTKYDGLGRIVEVGEMTLSSGYNFNENGQFTYGGLVVDLKEVEFKDLTGFISKEEVTLTKYDELVGAVPGDFEDYSADNTRNRITGVYYYESYDEEAYTGFDNATFYDYDVHGNVKELIQKISDADLLVLGQAEKKTQYEYDLVSGNVKHVTYQKDSVDQFIHEYEYDSDNRITNVRTSKDKIIWEQDAKYFYYNHGPLARVEIGDKKVQATDFAYTIQGWLKGVNSEDLSAHHDQGKDSKVGINSMIGKDVYGYSLHYYDNDYQARHGNDFLAYSEGIIASSHSKNLYNGNIKEMYTASTDKDEVHIGTSHKMYNYDQLNRIRKMAQEHLNGAASPESRYASNYSYDSNGNLDELNRWGWDETEKIHIDSFKYHYDDPLNNNKLIYVHDMIGDAGLGDLADQLSLVVYDEEYDDINNYAYDEIGQLIQDKQEEIVSIEWKVTGKVHKIIRELGSSKNNLEFVYDAMGNRIIKIVRNNSNTLLNKTYYIRDAQGNVMSTYTLTDNETEPYKELTLTERSIYGNSRLGLESPELMVLASYDPEFTIEVANNNQVVGDKMYELSNHLGNVLEVVSDRKLQMETFEGSGILDYYTADVVSYSDYYPFGMLLPNRNGSEEDYRYGFNGMEKDDEVTGDKGTSYDFGARLFNPRVGRWLSGDALEKKYPELSLYCFAGNSPILFVDFDGNDFVVTGKEAEKFVSMTEGFLKNITITRDQETGMISYNYIDGGTKEGLTEFETTIISAITAKDITVTVDAVLESDKILVDGDVRDGGSNEVDMHDLSLLDGMDKFKEALVGHFIEERLSSSESFSDAHQDGIDKETKILKEAYPGITSRSPNLIKEDISVVSITKGNYKFDYIKLLDYGSESEDKNNSIWAVYMYKEGETPNLHQPVGFVTTDSVIEATGGEAVDFKTDITE